MDPLENWNPRPAIRKWMDDANRRQSNVTVASKTTSHKPYFKHIFEAAEDDEDNESKTKENIPKFEF